MRAKSISIEVYKIALIWPSAQSILRDPVFQHTAEILIEETNFFTTNAPRSTNDEM